MADQTPSVPGQPKVPPFGNSPATAPVPNRGHEAAAKSRMGFVVKALEEVLQLAGASSDVGKDIMKMLQIAVKHAQAGDVTPAAERQQLDQLRMRNTQNQKTLSGLQQGMAQGGGQQPQQAAAA